MHILFFLRELQEDVFNELGNLEVFYDMGGS